MGEKIGYGFITKYVALDPEITADAKAVYMVLCSMADKCGVCNPMVKTIRAYTGLSEYRFYNAMQNLREHGIVKATQSKEGSTFARNTYHLLDRPYLKISGTDSDEDNPKYLGTECTGNTQTPRTQNDANAILSYPTDLGVKQYQCLNSTNDKNNTKSKQDICTHVLACINGARAKGWSKGRLKRLDPIKNTVNELLDYGLSDNEIRQAANEFAQKPCKFALEKDFAEYCKQRHRR